MRPLPPFTHVVLVAIAAISCSPANTGAPPDSGVESGVLPDAGADSGDASSAAEQVCKQYAYARCTRIQTCSPTAILFDYDDVATCETYFTASCVLGQLSPSTGASPATVQACIADLPNWACSDLVFGENIPPGCSTPQGSLVNGTACSVNAQCQSAWCGRLAGSSCGTCGPLPQPGDPCAGEGSCGSGLTCLPARTCATHAEVGAACNATQPCDEGLTCTAGICQAGVATAGALCTIQGPGCDEYAGLACNGATGVCETLVVATAGEACGIVANQLQDCQAAVCTRGVCVGDAPLGGACDLVAGPSCTSFAVCVVTSDGGTGGTCQIPGTGCTE
jgi:hypothetical protein